MITGLIIGLISLYAFICLAFYFGQDYFFFRPEILPKTFEYKYDFPFDEISLETPDGGELNGIYFKVPNSLGVIYYLKGNSRSIKGWGKFAKDFLSLGYDFFMIDYRGFGKSSGKRSEKTMGEDAQFVYDWLRESYERNEIVVLGRSLGSGFAAKVVSENPAKMLILDSPYYSFSFQISRFIWWIPLKFLLRYKIPTNKYLQNIRIPIFLIHGNKDVLISYMQSEMLMKENPDFCKLVTIEGGSHNNLPRFPEYHRSLYKILHTKSTK
jgi:pimeloyl-ACP methyl ester carboxylesterase